MLSKTRTSIEEYKKLKQAVITQAVTKGIRGDREMKNSGIEWIGKIPIEWKERISPFRGTTGNSKLSGQKVLCNRRPYHQERAISFRDRKL